MSMNLLPDYSMNTDIPFDLARIPASFARCFQGDCPKAGACVRFLAGKHVPAGKLSGPAVYPTARRGDDCELYKPTRVIRAAYGFTALFAEVKRKDDTPLRDRLKAYLGGNTTYYRYHHGERLLTPEQQEWILALFRRKGYTEGLRFDGYKELYDFGQGI